MPDDLLQFVSGPPRYAPGWLWLGLALLVLVAAWYTAVIVATLPAHRLRRMPVLRDLHARVLRHRFARRAAAVVERHRRGDLSVAQSGAALSATLRSFLHQATGVPAQYMQVRAVAASELAAAAPVLVALGEAQFRRDPAADVAQLGARTAEVIRSWR